VRDIFDFFEFENEIERMRESNILYLVVSKFCDVDLHPNTVPNEQMGLIFENLIRRINELANETAGDHFTPREVIRLMVNILFINDDKLLATPGTVRKLLDPACGTGGFLLAAFEYLKDRTVDPSEVAYLRTRTLHGVDLVPNVARLCAMNLFLHGIGTDHKHPVISISDSLESRAQPADMVLTNPPFGKKSSFIVIGADGKNQTEKISYERDDFWTTTSNKQLNFVQHVYSMLKENGRAAVVVPDNVLFESGAGEKIRRTLLQVSEVHTILRLPTGIWYSPGIKANVIFFDKKAVSKTAATKEVWVYDLRSNRNFSLRQNPIGPDDLVDFIRCYSADDRTRRKETAQFRRFTLAEILERDKANIDIQWQPEMTEGTDIETPQALMKEILKDLEEAMREFAAAESEIGH